MLSFSPKKIASLLACSGFLFSLFFLTTPILADDYGLGETLGTVGDKGLIKDTPSVVVGRVVGTILSLVGVAFFLLIIYGGLRWMLSQGNEQEVEKAKQVIIAAAIGLIIVMAAYAITAFVGEHLTGSNVT